MVFLHPGFPGTERSFVWLVLYSDTVGDQSVLAPHVLVNFSGPFSEPVFLGDEDLKTDAHKVTIKVHYRTT